MVQDTTQQVAQVAQVVVAQVAEVIQPLAVTVQPTQAQAVVVQETHQAMLIPQPAVMVVQVL
jgi:hypothetical protein